MTKSNPQRPAALITGGAKRIGCHLARHLAGQGFDIALHYHTSAAEAKKAVTQIRKLGVDGEAFSVDLTDPAATEALMPRVRTAFPRLNLLINSASTFSPSPLGRCSPEMFDHFYAIHVRAPFILSAAFARQARQGNIINILDTRITGFETSHAAYLLSKKSLRDLTRLAAREFAPRVRVNAIAPGLILPPPDKDAAYLNRRADSVPLKTTGHPDDIARSVDYLLNNPFVTGQILFQDGGEHLQ